MTSLYERAEAFARARHQNQTRKDPNSRPYIEHPLRVVTLLKNLAQVSDPLTLACAVLHDTLEDTATTSEELAQHFNQTVSAIVQELTDDKTLPKPERKLRQIAISKTLSPQASLVRFSDKIANLEDVLNFPAEGWSLQRRSDYASFAYAVIANLPHKPPALEAYLEELRKKVEEQILKPLNEGKI